MPKIVSPGKEAVEQAFQKHLSNISEFQGENERLSKRKRGFKKAVLADPNITKEDIVDFINEHAFNWALYTRIARCRGS